MLVAIDPRICRFRVYLYLQLPLLSRVHFPVLDLYSLVQRRRQCALRTVHTGGDSELNWHTGGRKNRRIKCA